MANQRLVNQGPPNPTHVVNPPEIRMRMTAIALEGEVEAQELILREQRKSEYKAQLTA